MLAERKTAAPGGRLPDGARLPATEGTAIGVWDDVTPGVEMVAQDGGTAEARTRRDRIDSRVRVFE